TAVPRETVWQDVGVTGAVTYALRKTGYLRRVAAEDGSRRVYITEAGRKALAAHEKAAAKTPVTDRTQTTGDTGKLSWNGEFYVSFGGDREWEEARRYGFISAGGGAWYSQTLELLEPGGRIWVN